MTDLKKCFRCREVKAREQFGRDKTRGDGLAAACKACRRVKVRVCRKGEASPFKGRSHTPDAKVRCGLANIGNTYRLGKKHTEESKRKMGQTKRARGHLIGPKNPRWNPRLHRELN